MPQWLQAAANIAAATFAVFALIAILAAVRIGDEDRKQGKNGTTRAEEPDDGDFAHHLAHFETGAAGYAKPLFRACMEW